MSSSNRSVNMTVSISFSLSLSCKCVCSFLYLWHCIVLKFSLFFIVTFSRDDFHEMINKPFRPSVLWHCWLACKIIQNEPFCAGRGVKAFSLTHVVFRCLAWTVWLVSLCGSISCRTWNRFRGTVFSALMNTCSLQCHCTSSAPQRTFPINQSVLSLDRTRSAAVCHIFPLIFLLVCYRWLMLSYSTSHPYC